MSEYEWTVFADDADGDSSMLDPTYEEGEAREIAAQWKRDLRFKNVEVMRRLVSEWEPVPAPEEKP